MERGRLINLHLAPPRHLEKRQQRRPTQAPGPVLAAVAILAGGLEPTPPATEQGVERYLAHPTAKRRCLPVALEDESYITWYAEQVRLSRERIVAALNALCVPQWPSHANFVLMKIGSQHAAVVEGMRRRGILIRDRSRDPGCDGCVRITAGTLEQTERGLAALAETLKELQWQPQK